MRVTIDDHGALYVIAENSSQRFIPVLLSDHIL
jgi:hypothetical protein